MESIGSSEVTTDFVTADELRDITISKEDRFERDRTNVLTSLMDSMVKQATDIGAFAYSANLHPQFDPVLLETVQNDLTELGYSVSANELEDKAVGKFIQLQVSWASEDPSLVSEVVETDKDLKTDPA